MGDPTPASGRPPSGTGNEAPEDVDADVAIVGYGPVGSALAILLAQLGHRVVVLERWPEPYGLPRAVHLDHEVARIIQACGLGAQLRATSEPAHVYEWQNGEGTTLLRFGRVGDALSGWPESSMFHQPTLEAALDRRACALPGITVRRGFEVDGLVVDDDGVIVRGMLHATNATGDTQPSAVRARYVVGCDGANSTVRGLSGLPVHDLGFHFDWLIVDVVLHEARTFDPVNVQICDPGRPTTAVSGGPGRRRWEFMRLPGESLDDLHDEARAWALLEPWAVTPTNARLERHAVYTFNARYAEQWRAGRVLLAGDAAHLMPPFAGQGMCAGIRDAANLAWKLDLVLQGLAPDGLLDTYQDERLPSARQAIEFSVELGKVICVADPAEAAARDEAMAASVTADLADAPAMPGIGSGVVHPSSPAAGALFPQGTIDGRPFDDVAGVGWRLVTVEPDDQGAALDPGAVDWFTPLGGRVVAVANTGGSSFGRWFADHGVTWALQRPDFHLFGTARSAAGASGLLDDLRAQLDNPNRATDQSIPEGALS